MSARYAVDLDQLSATVESLAAVGARLSCLVDDLHARVAALHLTWSGVAADRHSDAHRAWEAGFAEMGEGLAAMRAAAQVAHTNYQDAAHLNVSLWEQLR